MRAVRQSALALALVCLVITSFLPSADAATTNHIYDSLNRLVQSVIRDGSKTTTIIYEYDAAGNMTRSETSLGFVLEGDVNGDGTVNLEDAVLALQLLSGTGPNDVNHKSDVNGDSKIGMAEVFYVLQNMAGLR
jgi:YD repeat-containing protein